MKDKWKTIRHQISNTNKNYWLKFVVGIDFVSILKMYFIISLDNSGYKKKKPIKKMDRNSRN